jgi:hypothetical protein
MATQQKMLKGEAIPLAFRIAPFVSFCAASGRAATALLLSSGPTPW